MHMIIIFHLHHVTTLLQCDWYAIILYETPGQGSVTFLTGPYLAGARRGLGTRLTLAEVKHMHLIGPSSPVSEPGVHNEC